MLPTMVCGGLWKSDTDEPSRRNSGLKTSEPITNLRPLPAPAAARCASVVPGATVLRMTSVVVVLLAISAPICPTTIQRRQVRHEIGQGGRGHRNQRNLSAPHGGGHRWSPSISPAFTAADISSSMPSSTTGDSPKAINLTLGVDVHANHVVTQLAAGA